MKTLLEQSSFTKEETESLFRVTLASTFALGREGVIDYF